MSNLDKCQQCGKLAYQGDTVTVTAAEFEALTKAAEEGGDRKALQRYRLRSKSPIARNRELAEFILDRADTMTVTEIAAAAKVEYGDTAPSRSAVYRFVQTVLGRP